MTEYIARISYGKDSLKMLDVIHSRGLPLDRITTTDVWATDTISANLPPVEAFKAKMDQWIWDRYRIEVEHLCTRNKDGSKKTYEQMFYHVPVRRSQIVQAERERERDGSGSARSSDFPTCGIRGVKLHSSGLPAHMVLGTITGFPPNTRYNWCQKLKICPDINQRISACDRSYMVPEAQNQDHPAVFCQARHDGREEKYRGISRNSGRRTETAWAAEREKTCAAG